MMRRLSKTYLCIVGVLCVVYSFASPVKGQAETNWQRVFTAEEFIVDIDPASLTFLPDHVLSAKFRTVFSTQQPTGGEVSKRYEDRIDTIEFRRTAPQQSDVDISGSVNHDETSLRTPTLVKHKKDILASPVGRGYRIVATSFLDSTGKIIKSVTDPASDWKSPAEITERELTAAQALSPLGRWKVIEYRYADAGQRPTTEPPELVKLIGTQVRLEPDAAEVEGKTCQTLNYLSRQLTSEEFSKALGTTPDTLGLMTSSIETIKLNCDGGQWKPAQSLLIKLPEGRMLMLWNGVFLVLTKATGLEENPPRRVLKQRP